MGFEAIMANAYLLMKNLGGEARAEDVHSLLSFDGVIMTDSGAYQLLTYGEVEASPEEIVDFQVKIGSDIAVILDVPTGHPASRSRAEYTVEETLRRARALFSLERGKALWVGPIQGGTWLDLVERCAASMASLPFDVYALGSPTKVMEQYMFDVLVDMLAAAKPRLPLSKPFHLFGAGHPMMFSLAVALGCDTFDSASYAIYARQGRYMVEDGTLHVKDLEQLPCTCPICSKLTAKELREMPKVEREQALAKHNLYVCLAELRRIRQAIAEGRLWELLERRGRGHPAVNRALRRLADLAHLLEEGTPVSKPKGLFLYDSLSLHRPEAYRFRRRVVERLSFNRPILAFLPPPPTRPFSRSKAVKRALKQLYSRLGGRLSQVDLCVYATPLGIIPLELDETYPASQHEHPRGLEPEVFEEVCAKQVAEILSKARSKAVVYVHSQRLKGYFYTSALKACVDRGILFKALVLNHAPWSRKGIEELASLLVALLEKTEGIN